MSDPLKPEPTPLIDWCGRRHPVELIMMATTFAAIVLAVIASL